MVKLLEQTAITIDGVPNLANAHLGVLSNRGISLEIKRQVNDTTISTTYAGFRQEMKVDPKDEIRLITDIDTLHEITGNTNSDDPLLAIVGLSGQIGINNNLCLTRLEDVNAPVPPVEAVQMTITP